MLEANAEPKRGAFETWQSALSASARAWRAPRTSSASKAEAGLRRPHVAQGVRRPRRAADRAGDLRPGRGALSSSRAATSRSASACASRRCWPTPPRSRSAAIAPAALRGEEIWCQLFSEPGAGSDLAGLRTRAVRDGDDWVINGQKIWTSGAHCADYGILVTRSDPKAPKHKGLTFFFLDMKSPGHRGRGGSSRSPGSRNFNEVYFTDVRIPDSQRLGARRSGLGRGDHHAHERAPHRRASCAARTSTRCSRWPRTVELEDGPAIDNAGGARAARRLVRAPAGRALDALPHHDRARRAARRRARRTRSASSSARPSRRTSRRSRWTCSTWAAW